MTTPTERTRAVQQLEQAVEGLRRYAYGKGKKALVPRDELQHVLAWLRHYPTSFELQQAADALPGVFGKPDASPMWRPAPYVGSAFSRAECEAFDKLLGGLSELKSLTILAKDSK